MEKFFLGAAAFFFIPLWVLGYLIGRAASMFARGYRNAF
jgi:uncharacterized membrane protein